ncbi:MAG: hypothetical protein KIT33_15955 [Candidatus Kapabacteria bacterium]|nr:hypothetical protein [Ignavibacteriota bacterium]MCW5886466.1 hypothetical protein [Candidatus Kapabacteria bacterium]
MLISKKNIEKNLQKPRMVLELAKVHRKRLNLLMKRTNTASQTRLISALIDAAYEEYFPNNSGEEYE